MPLERFAVIGHPIGHSISPFIHEKLFALSGFSPEYTVLDVAELSGAMERLRMLDGFNITIPHKTAILPLLDRLDAKARLFGSVNTVKNEAGVLSGYTTDGPGCRAALETAGVPLAGRLLLLGRGGAARAIAFEAAFSADALELDIVCRASSLQNARILAAELQKLCPKGSFRALDYETLAAETKRYDLALNTTSVGMYPDTGVSVVDGEVLSRCAAAFDAVYNPVTTEFLRIAGELGLKTVGGMGMLVGQAAEAHRIWYGAAFCPEDIARITGEAEAEIRRRFGGQ